MGYNICSVVSNYCHFKDKLDHKWVGKLHQTWLEGVCMCAPIVDIFKSTNELNRCFKKWKTSDSEEYAIKFRMPHLGYLIQVHIPLFKKRSISYYALLFRVGLPMLKVVLPWANSVYKNSLLQSNKHVLCLKLCEWDTYHIYGSGLKVVTQYDYVPFSIRNGLNMVYSLNCQQEVHDWQWTGEWIASMLCNYF